MANKKLNLYVFADERKNINNQWDYIALLFIKREQTGNAIRLIARNRKRFNYYHELKFSEIIKTKGEKFTLAEALLKEIVADAKNKNDIFYWTIFGIDISKIDFSRFGIGKTKKGKYANLYNRFFRTAFLQIKWFFPEYDEILIHGIFHDNEGNLQNHKYFNWHLIQKISKENKKIKFKTEEITFIDSDHRKEKHHSICSHFIQLIDILVGSVTYCFDPPDKPNKAKHELANIVKPLVKKLTKNPYNKNSSYYRKYSISFFPKNKSSLDREINLNTKKIYHYRKVVLGELFLPFKKIKRKNK